MMAPLVTRTLLDIGSNVAGVVAKKKSISNIIIIDAIFHARLDTKLHESHTPVNYRIANPAENAQSLSSLSVPFKP